MKTSVTALSLVCTSLFCFACGGDSHDDPNANGPGGAAPAVTTTSPATTQASSDKAQLRVVHASSDAPKVDVYAKGVATPLLRDVAYGDTSAYLDVPVGAVTIELRAAPSSATDPVAFATGPLTLEKGSKTTAVAAGLLASKDQSNAFRILPLAEKFGIAAKGQALVRVVHAGADAPTVGIDIGNDDPQAPEIPALTRFEDTSANGTPLPAGAPLAIGIDVGGKRVTSFSTTALPDGGEIFIVATGLLAETPRTGGGFSLLAIGPKGTLGFIRQDPTVYALHAAPDAPPVDGFVGTTKLIDNLAFGKLAQPLQVPPGDYVLDIFAHVDTMVRPSGAPVASKKIASLAAGQRYLAVASGFVAPASANEPALRLDAYADEFALDNATGAQIRAIHASPDAPAVDIGVMGSIGISPVIFKDLTFGNASTGAGSAVPAGSVRLGVTPTGQNNTVAAKFDVVPASQQRVFAVATGTLNPHRATSFRLLLVDTGEAPWALTAVHPSL